MFQNSREKIVCYSSSSCPILPQVPRRRGTKYHYKVLQGPMRESVHCLNHIMDDLDFSLDILPSGPNSFDLRISQMESGISVVKL